MGIGNRLTLAAALGALLLALLRLGRLLTPAPIGPPWLPVALAATVVGAAVIAVALAAGARNWLVLALTALGATLAVFRVSAAPSLWLGVIPTPASLPLVGEEMRVALELIRYGSAPVLAATGLVAVLASVFFSLGATVAFGLARRRPLIAVLPTLTFYLMLATFDRRPPAWWWPVLMALCAAAALLASVDRHAGGRAKSTVTGRLIPSAGRLLPLVTVAILAVTAGSAARSFAATVPESGMIAWRTPTGFGGGLFGGVSYNLFTGLQQELNDRNPQVVFVARVSESAPPNAELYWKLITLDSYDGEFWLPANLEITRPAQESDWEAADFVTLGPVVRVESIVRIVALRQNYLPIIYSPRRLESTDQILNGSYQAREDGSVRFDARTSDGLTYSVISDIPMPDISVLASTGGELSPIFANAQSAGQFPVAPSSQRPPLPSARVRDVYTSLPDDFSPEITALANQLAEPGSTAFERALLLQQFFRQRGGFVYDSNVSTGHTELDLARWLLDPDSRNYRTGYCEQFATALAVMARAVGIPARVVLGFAPGELTRQSDGSELIVVSSNRSHAWVELFMAGQGWMRFDPTPRSDGVNPGSVPGVAFDPSLFLPEPADPNDPGQIPRQPEDLDLDFLEQGADPTLGLPGNSGLGPPVWTRVLIVLAGAVVLVPGFKALRRGSRLARLDDGDLTAGWVELVDRLHDLGQPLGWWLTPVEVARQVDPALLPLATRFSANIYGGYPVRDGLRAYRDAETALKQRFSGWRWWGSWFHPRSLWRRNWAPPDEVSGPRIGVPRSRRLRPGAAS